MGEIELRVAAVDRAVIDILAELNVKMLCNAAARLKSEYFDSPPDNISTLGAFVRLPLG